MTKTNARRAVRRFIAGYLRDHALKPPDILPAEVIAEWPTELPRIADRIERGDLVRGHRLRLE